MNYIRRQVIKKYIAYLLRKLAINVLYITFFCVKQPVLRATLSSCNDFCNKVKPEVIQTHGNTFVSL